MTASNGLSRVVRICRAERGYLWAMFKDELWQTQALPTLAAVGWVLNVVTGKFEAWIGLTVLCAAIVAAESLGFIIAAASSALHARAMIKRQWNNYP